MWECKYGKEPLNTRLFVLQLFRKAPVILLAAILGVICVGGPYFLTKVTFGPAKEYEAVTDFYIDYAVKEDGTQHTYINFATWDQLLKDDVFTDKILFYMAGEGVFAEEEAQSAPLDYVEKAAGITKQELRGYLHGDVLSDTRIVTTTVTTNDPALTMKIEKALVQAMFDFGEAQREIAELRILQEPTQASLVVADVRTFRACMVGLVSFVFVTVLYLCLYYALDEGIHIPGTFERRFGVPMLGTIRSKELSALAGKLLSEKPVLLTADREVDLEQVKAALAERKIEAGEVYRFDELVEEVDPKQVKEAGKTAREKRESLRIVKWSGEWSAGDGEEALSAAGRDAELPGQERSGELTDTERNGSQFEKKFLLIVKAGAHNGKQTEKVLDFCDKCGLDVAAALLWEADEKLIRAYELPEHVLFAWRRQNKEKSEKRQTSL